MKNVIEESAFSRAGVLGNPSDGFYGKTLSVPIKNFEAQICIFKWKKLEIIPNESDKSSFGSYSDFLKNLEINGYYGGMRLIKSSIKTFHEYCLEMKQTIPEMNFCVKYCSDIPRQVGLAGSSAFITATMKAMLKFFDIPFDRKILPNYVLRAETELGISGGLQDRVVQVFGEPVFMDFSKEIQEKNDGCGEYFPLDKELLPPLYLSYKKEITHSSVVHNDMRRRFNNGEEKVVNTMKMIAEVAQVGYDALKKKNLPLFKACIDDNFNLRNSIYEISNENLKMIEIARSCGATAKFAGGGGAIIGTYDSEDDFVKLKRALEELKCEVVKVKI